MAHVEQRDFCKNVLICPIDYTEQRWEATVHNRSSGFIAWVLEVRLLSVAERTSPYVGIASRLDPSEQHGRLIYFHVV